MTDPLTLTAALLLGLATSGHCVLMCGGISSALAVATTKNAKGRPRWLLLIGYQFGRITSYAMAGLLIAGTLGGVVQLLDVDAVRYALRMLTVLALLVGAAAALGVERDLSFGLGRKVWAKLAPMGRRLLPIATLPRAFTFGMLWGWMPCGFVYTVLVIASLQLDALRGAAVMAAFGLGTIPALLATSAGARHFTALASGRSGRRVAAVVLVGCAALTVASPWLMHAAPQLHGWLPFDCNISGTK